MKNNNFHSKYFSMQESISAKAHADLITRSRHNYIVEVVVQCFQCAPLTLKVPSLFTAYGWDFLQKHLVCTNNAFPNFQIVRSDPLPS